MPAFGRNAFVAAGFFLVMALSGPAIGAESAAIGNFSGQWGRDTLFFEPPESGPGPIIRMTRNPDGTPTPRGLWIGDLTNPILKPETADFLRNRLERSKSGLVVPDAHNSCWPEPPPYVLAVHFGVHIVEQKDKVTLVYLLHNTVRHVRMNEPHPKTVTPSWLGDSVGWYEGDTLVIDTIGIKVDPLSAVDMFGTPHTDALHVVERYRLIDGEAAAEAQRKKGTIANLNAYGRGDLDPDTSKKGLQVDVTVEDDGVYTMPWSARITYRPIMGGWPEVICAENPFYLGTSTANPVADAPDF